MSLIKINRSDSVKPKKPVGNVVKHESLLIAIINQKILLNLMT